MEIEESSILSQEATPTCSEPLHVKRVLKALELEAFLQPVSNVDNNTSDEENKIVIVDDDLEEEQDVRKDSTNGDLKGTLKE